MCFSESEEMNATDDVDSDNDIGHVQDAERAGTLRSNRALLGVTVWLIEIQGSQNQVRRSEAALQQVH